VQLLPFAEFLTRSEIMGSRGGGGWNLAALLGNWREWPALVTALLPRFWGSGQAGSYWYPFSNGLEQTVYVGVLPLLLALVALADGWRRRHAYPQRGNPHLAFWAWVGLISLGLALALPLLHGLTLLPGLNLVAAGRLRLIYVLAAALLAGMGLDRLAESQGEGVRATLGRLLMAGALLALAGNGAAAVGLRLLRERILDMGRAQAAAAMAQANPLFWQPLAYYFDRVELLHAKMLGLFAPSHLLAWWPVGLGVILWLLLRAGMGRRAWFAPLAVALAGADLLLFGAGLNPSTPTAAIFPTPPLVAQVQAAQGDEPVRVVGQGLALMPNSALLYAGLSDIRGYDAMIPGRYADLLRRIPGNVRVSHYILFADIASPVLDLLNVGVAFVPGESPIPDPEQPQQPSWATSHLAGGADPGWADLAGRFSSLLVGANQVAWADSLYLRRYHQRGREPAA